MSTMGIIMMVTTMSIIIVFTGYFFLKVIRTPNKSERDEELK